ncbi:MFS transporter [Streptomyces fuscigenes]|uniref:MFS transporter n=1 Tax=Streptomyces fuscigenes TaxID=1528880 RepID=UPI001F2448A4|nr:MFS transporter [Streptomyces fuscigenes]MCF3961213.1 MFS transporter [Streptomyces fuscigenes]
MTNVNDSVSAPPAQVHRLLVPGLVFMGMVVAVVSSLGAPLIPTIAESDHISVNDAQWALTVTFLMAAVATPLTGRLGDGPHRRRVIIAALAAVTAGAVLAALPLGFPFLLVGRAMQGIGLGLTPLGITVVRDALPVERSRPAAAVLSVTTVAGVGLGYPVTGLVAQFGGLHAAFWFGAVVSALGLAVAAIVVPSSAHRPRRPVDLPGGILLGASLVGLLLALSEGESWGWTSPLLLGVVAGSLLVLAGWVLRELRAAHPLVDLRLLRRPTVLTADVTALLAGVGMYLLISLVTRFVQTPVSSGYGLGASVFVAGLVLVPFSAASVVSTRITRVLVTRIPVGAALALGAFVMLLAMLVFSYARGAMWEVLVVMALAGLGVGAIFAVMPGLIVGSVPPHETGSATSFNQVIRYIGYAAGSTLSAVVLETHTAPAHALPSDSGYTDAGLVAVVMWIATAVAALVLPRLRPRAADGTPVPSAGSAEATPAERRGRRTASDRVLADEGLADAVSAGPVETSAATPGGRAATAAGRIPPHETTED